MPILPGAEPWSAIGHGERARVGVALVHGFTGSPTATRPLGRALADAGYTVEVPLLPGHGTHHRDLARTRYEDWYRAVEAVADRIARRCERVVLVGHSAGGTLALDVATRGQVNIDAVAVINPLVRPPHTAAARLSPVLQHVIRTAPRDLVGMPTDDIALPGVSEVAYRHVPSRAARSLVAALPRVRAQLPDLVQPLLVVRSSEDHTVPTDGVGELLEFVGSPDIRELVCGRSYHVPQLDVDAAEVTTAVLELLADVHEGVARGPVRR